jgi:hypothetical protein
MNIIICEDEEALLIVQQQELLTSVVKLADLLIGTPRRPKQRKRWT